MSALEIIKNANEEFDRMHSTSGGAAGLENPRNSGAVGESGAAGGQKRPPLEPPTDAEPPRKRQRSDLPKAQRAEVQLGAPQPVKSFSFRG